MKTKNLKIVKIKNNLLKIILATSLILSGTIFANSQSLSCKESEMMTKDCICKIDAVSKKEDLPEGFSLSCVKGNRVNYSLNGKAVTEQEFSSAAVASVFSLSSLENAAAKFKVSMEKVVSQSFEDFVKDLKSNTGVLEVFFIGSKCDGDYKIKAVMNKKGQSVECENNKVVAAKFILNDKEVTETEYLKNMYIENQSEAKDILNAYKKSEEDFAKGIVKTCFTSDPNSNFCEGKNKSSEPKTPTSTKQNPKPISLKKSLKLGSRDPQVRIIQDILYTKGYLKNTPNGYFGKGTLQAVKDYQRDNNLIVTGVVGNMTFEHVMR